MKKTIVLLAGIALMAAGCTKTEVVTSGPEGSQKGINFAAYASRTTKAAQVDVTADNFSKFEVSAFGNSSTYFSGVTFEKSSTTPPVWESNPLYFWPAYTLDFYAYNRPQNGTFEPTINTETKTIKFEPSTVLAEQEDLVAAVATNQSDPSGATVLNFNHYLTQVIVKAMSSNANYVVKVYGVKLANLAGEGTYTYSDGKMVATDTKQNSNASSDYSATFSEKTLSTTAVEVMTDAGNGRWYLVPQTSVTAWTKVVGDSNTAHGTYLALKVNIATTGGSQIYPKTGESAWMAVPISSSEIAFAQGKKYTVTVNFFGSENPGAGFVDPEEPGELDGDGATKDEGKPIVGGAIKFNAIVSEWDETNTAVTINL